MPATVRRPYPPPDGRHDRQASSHPRCRTAPPGGWGYGYGPYGPGYAAPARPPVKHTSHAKLISLFVVGMLVVVGGFLLIAKAATPEKKARVPPTCPQPPVGDPVVAMPRFTAPTARSASATRRRARSSARPAAERPACIVPINVGDGGAILLQGGSARGQTAEQVVTAFVRREVPRRAPAYVVPNALVGYQAGYGEVDDVYPQSTDGVVH